MTRTVRLGWVAGLCVVAILLAGACNRPSDNAQQENEPQRGGSTSRGTGTEPQLLIQSLDGVGQAVVRVDSQGLMFEDPETGEAAPGTGSAFIIDPEGIAVTNQHVVTGAQSISVQVEGEEDTRSAEVLGASECSDVAVLDIDGGGYPYLDWHEGGISAGMDVFAFGYPTTEGTEEELREPRLTDGVVSRPDASGDTVWTSVESTIEHTADLLPGNSGGPLVDSSGRTVGVNFANIFETSQEFAIPGSELQEIIKPLRQGENVYYLGINGIAIEEEEARVEDFPGEILVFSVEPGSAADEAGLESGDLIVQLQGGDVAADGTMKEYCDVLRSNPRPDDVLDLMVARPEDVGDPESDMQCLEGQINGEPLKRCGTASAPTGSTPAEQTDNTAAAHGDSISGSDHHEGYG